MSHIPPKPPYGQPPNRPQSPNRPYQQPGYPPIQPGMPPQENTMGVAGFICSIIGLISCGLASPIALVLSGIGLKREPKGFATAGVVIGGIGTLMLIATVVMFIGMVRTGRRAVQQIGSQVTRAAAAVKLNDGARQIATEWEQTGELPDEDRGGALIASLRDPWGNSIVYESLPGLEEEEAGAFSVRSFGEDELEGTDDDIEVGPFYDAQTAMERTRGFEEILEEGLEDIEKEIEIQNQKNSVDTPEGSGGDSAEENGMDSDRDEEDSSPPILDFDDDH